MFEFTYRNIYLLLTALMWVGFSTAAACLTWAMGGQEHVAQAASPLVVVLTVWSSGLALAWAAFDIQYIARKWARHICRTRLSGAR